MHPILRSCVYQFTRSPSSITQQKETVIVFFIFDQIKKWQEHVQNLERVSLLHNSVSNRPISLILRFSYACYILKQIPENQTNLFFQFFFLTLQTVCGTYVSNLKHSILLNEKRLFYTQNNWDNSQNFEAKRSILISIVDYIWFTKDFQNWRVFSNRWRENPTSHPNSFLFYVLSCLYFLNKNHT